MRNFELHSRVYNGKTPSALKVSGFPLQKTTHLVVTPEMGYKAPPKLLLVANRKSYARSIGVKFDDFE